VTDYDIPREDVPDVEEPVIDVNLVDEPTDKAEPERVFASGGWASPLDQGYGLLIPEVTVRRGGISFSVPTPLAKWKRKDLVAEVERLRTTLEVVRRNERSLQRKNRRLRKALKRIIG
jgi:hypothetical protein